MVLDDLVQAVANAVESVERLAAANDAQRLEEQAADLRALLEGGPEAATKQELRDTANSLEDGDGEAAANVLRDILGELPEESQEVILEPLGPDAVENPEDVRQQLQEAEGGAVAQAAGVLGGTLAVEAASAGQLESQQFIVSQFLTFLALEDVIGKELETTVSEGVEPLLQQQVNKEYRSKKADLADAVEAQLRTKDSDTDYLDGLAEYGIREEDVSILEAAAISEVELDAQVQAGETTPIEATRALPDDVDEARDALRDRFELLEANARDAPSDSDTLGHLSRGIVGLQTAAEELSNPGRDDSETTRLLVEEILSELDGDLRTALGLGQIDDAAYSELASVAGVDQDAVNSLLDGDDLDEIALRRLRDDQTPAGQSVESIIGIGPARGSALAASDIETVQDLANADPEEVADIAQVTVDAARDFVEAAVRRTQA